MKIKLRFTLMMILCFFALPVWSAALSVDSLWVRAGPPNSKTLAAYGKLINTSQQSLVLDSVRSPDFQRVEMHRSLVKEGQVMMRRISTLIIPPGQSLAFEPNGLHMMLIGPNRQLKEGAVVQFSFSGSDGHTTEYKAKILKSSPTDTHSH